jgi:hypothetical protein
VVSSSQTPLPDNTQQTNIHAPGGIRTHDHSRRAAADLCLRPRGRWVRQYLLLLYGFNQNRYASTSFTFRCKISLKSLQCQQSSIRDGQTDRRGGADSRFSQFHESAQNWKQHFLRKLCPSWSANECNVTVNHLTLEPPIFSDRLEHVGNMPAFLQVTCCGSHPDSFGAGVLPVAAGG